MLLSTQTGYMVDTFGFEEGTKKLQRAGYDALDLSLFQMKNDASPYVNDGWREHTEAQRRFADEHGIAFNQAHAPFSFRWDDEHVRRDVAQPRVIRSLEIAAMMGAEIIIVHPLHYCVYKGHEREMHELNIDYYRSMIPYCREFGIKIAVENMWQTDPKRRCCSHDVASHAEEFARIIDELDSEYIVACLDLGHCGLVGEEAEDAIRVLGHDRLKALHVHDNNYRNDDHTLPGLGLMNWDAICSSLHDIDYSGVFTYEADRFLKQFPHDYLENAARFMVETGRYLINKIGL